jgi:hypothetical protein
MEFNIMNKDNLPDFSGKCISARLIDSDHSHDLNDPHFEYQGGRLFLVGIIPVGSTDSGWDADQVGAIDWAQVRNYVLFQDLESYTKAVEISDSYQADYE